MRQASPRVALRRFARTPRAQRRAEAHAAEPTGRACFFRPICCAFTPFGSSPLKLRVQAFEPIAARAAAIAAADAPRHDPLQAELASVGEHSRALDRQRCAEPDAVDARDQPRERLSPLFQRPLAEIVGFEAQKVEGDE